MSAREAVYVLDDVTDDDIARMSPAILAERERTDSGRADRVDRFSGKYRFLASMAITPMVHDGVIYPSLAHAYHASKLADPARRRRVARLPFPGDAVRKCRPGGELVPAPRPGWKAARQAIMADLVHAKYAQHPDLAAALLATDDRLLAHGSADGPRWGGDGLNWYGRIHMYERARLRAAALRRGVSASMGSAIVFSIFIGADGNAVAEPAVLSRRDADTYRLEAVARPTLVAGVPADPLAEIGFGATPWEGAGAVLPPEERILAADIRESAASRERCEAAIGWFVRAAGLPVTPARFSALLLRAAIAGEVRLHAHGRRARAEIAVKGALSAALGVEYADAREQVDTLAWMFGTISDRCGEL